MKNSYYSVEDRVFKIIKEVRNAYIGYFIEGWNKKYSIVNKITLAEKEIGNTWIIDNKYIIFYDKRGIGIYDCEDCRIVTYRQIYGIQKMKCTGKNILEVKIRCKGNILYSVYTSVGEINCLG